MFILLRKRMMENKKNCYLVIKDGEKLYKISKVMFWSDSSYYSTIPFHKSRKAYLFKACVNYDVGGAQLIREEDLIAPGDVEDQAIKYTHHPDGFVQYSGAGILSGRNKDSTIKGMGVMSFPLGERIEGPCFSYSISDYESLDKFDKSTSKAIFFDLNDYQMWEKSKSVVVEAHYFPPAWRRFITRRHDSKLIIRIAHPCGAILELLVFTPPLSLGIPGFLGFELFRAKVDLGEDGYVFSGLAGNISTNELNQKVGEAIFCCYPKPDGAKGKTSYNYPRKST
jgi:hypothetical protein